MNNYILFALSLLIVLALIILLIYTRKLDPDMESSPSLIIKPFVRAAFFFADKISSRKSSSYYRKLLEKNSLLYSPQKAVHMTKQHLTNKFTLLLLVMFLGNGFITLICVKSFFEPDNEQCVELSRQDFNGSSYSLDMNVSIDNDINETLNVTVNERILSKDEFYSSMDSFCSMLEESILNDNENVDNIVSDINLVQQIDGYPYTIAWTISNRDIINGFGHIWPNEDISEDDYPDGIIVILSADISYEDYSYIYEFGLHVYPKILSNEELILKHINESIQSNDVDSKETNSLKLPDSVDEMQITWTKKKTNNTLIFFLLIIVASLAIFFGKDNDISKQIAKRNDQLLYDYPEVISKLALLIGAGMSIRNAWRKIAYDYKQLIDTGSIDKHFIYEEMLITANEMDAGVEEIICFAHFSSRVKLQKYVKLVSLLEQNIRIGSKTFLDDLSSETKEAFFEKKNDAERLGEQAGTKLLLPMFLMLLIVMVVIMVPAFCNI